MRPNGLVIATAFLAVLGGVVWWSNRQKAAEDAKPKSEDATLKVLAIPEDQAVALTIVRRDGAEVVLKRSDNKWAMEKPAPLRVDADAVNGVLTSLTSLNATEVVEQKAADLAAFGLSTPATQVTVATKDGKTHTILLGDETPAGGDIYAKLGNDPRIFSLASHLKTNLDRSADDLRDKRLLAFDPDKLTRVELTANKQTVDFGKNSQNEWQILKPQPLRADGWQVDELVRKLREAKMESARDEDLKKAAAAWGSATPAGAAKVTDNTGTHAIEIRKAKDEYYAKSSFVEGVYKVSSEAGQALDKGLDDFRNKKLFDFGFSDPTRVEVRRDGKTTTYAKASDKWYAGTKQIDSASLQGFIDKLRDMSAAKFVNTGFTSPSFEVAVTSSDGKRVERVLLAKSGEDFYAKRENEPAIYQLDRTAGGELLKAAGEIKEAAPEPQKK